MDILYLVGNNSTSDFEDLKLSLRSLETYGRDVDRVFMCGFIPDFISDNVIKIPFEMNPTVLKEQVEEFSIKISNILNTGDNITFSTNNADFDK
mgnify:CR=1 FL=1